MKNSLVELSARNRAYALIDENKGRELVGPLDYVISPHLLPQGIVPESDDGVVLVKGKIAGKSTIIISIEGKFQGGGIGEVAGAKIVAALEAALQDNKNGHEVYPVIILDTGGVRLQEANYGLLAISEIQNVIVALKEFVPVIGLIPGKVGSFGGMSITAALMSYLIATDKARIALNGPEVIEQEAGVREFDASDKDLIWDTLGAKQRVKTGIVDEVVVDDVETIKVAINAAMVAKKDVHRTEKIDFYLSLLDQVDFNKELTPAKYNEIYAMVNTKPHFVTKALASHQKQTNSRGRAWFEALTGIKNAKTNVSTVLYAETDGKVYIAIVPDEHNSAFPRVKNGEVGLKEGFAVASIIRQVIKEDADKTNKRPIVAIVDVPSQAYGYKEELIGIHIALAASASAYAKARQVGHPVVNLIAGDAVSGGFLAHGLQANRMIALADKSIVIQAMSKASAARITQRTIAELEEATKHVPAMAYDIFNYQKLGALYKLVDNVKCKDVSPEKIKIIKDLLEQAIAEAKRDSTLHFRYENSIAQKMGRKATNKVRRLVKEQW
ncbi:MAG: biotin-independent malonate decarboxylase subunit beta [Ligilactobacillus agilis]|nr:biotin-independent malonate decarboxylase subunit beta [Ligilactobacillus agilis]MDY4065876.1 biotin-independent malonate decarboxylase subunit beta [Ligilactobacillus agilis]